MRKKAAVKKKAASEKKTGRKPSLKLIDFDFSLNGMGGNIRVDYDLRVYARKSKFRKGGEGFSYSALVGKTFREIEVPYKSVAIGNGTVGKDMITVLVFDNSHLKERFVIDGERIASPKVFLAKTMQCLGMNFKKIPDNGIDLMFKAEPVDKVRHIYKINLISNENSDRKKQK